MEQTNIIEKIKKLLNMAKRGTKHEREVAYLKAQEMMAKHHIEMDAIEEVNARRVIEVVVKLNIKSTEFAYLASVIAKNFRCENFVRYSSKRFLMPVFLGLELDVQVASEIFKDAYNYSKTESRRTANYYYREYGFSDGVAGDWILGFIEGLEAGFKSQIELSSETSLMVIMPEEVRTEYSKRRQKFANEEVKYLTINRNGDRNIHRAGYQNGYNFSTKRKQEAISFDI